jgi:hypothetical protein
LFSELPGAGRRNGIRAAILRRKANRRRASVISIFAAKLFFQHKAAMLSFGRQGAGARIGRVCLSPRIETLIFCQLLAPTFHDASRVRRD